MKKISILLLAAIAFISCGNTYEAKTIRLADEDDSLNYAIGMINGIQIKMYQMGSDTTAQTINEFLDALIDGYNGKAPEMSEIETEGKRFGIFLKQCEKDGLLQQKQWTLNEKLLLQGFANGLAADTSVMTVATAAEYFQMQYYAMAAMGMNNEDKVAGKVVRSKLTDKAKTVTLKNQNDSLNYAFGQMQGDMMLQRLLSDDIDGTLRKELVDAINLGLADKSHNPQLKQMALMIGQTISEQESEGLLLIPEAPTYIDIIVQGFTNGFYGYTDMMTMEEASELVNRVRSKRMYSIVKVEGEQFLAENAKRAEVTVTESGLQYEVLKMGKGTKPQATDRVKVHYHGTLINGKVFDSSIERGEPVSFALNGVIPGWTEGLQLMPVGSKFRFYIPQELAYGAAEPSPEIKPYSALIFEVELLDIEK